jgi:hypothetical protein
MSSSKYIKSFFEKGRIIVNEKNRNFSENKKMFKSILIELHTEHQKFVEECTRENILMIDHQNLIIELIL